MSTRPRSLVRRPEIAGGQSHYCRHPASIRLSGSARLEWFDRGTIDGIDPVNVAPVQTVDPSRQAAMRTDLALGLNLAASGGHRLAFELSLPIAQDLDGPQLETDDQLTFGYQLSF